MISVIRRGTRGPVAKFILLAIALCMVGVFIAPNFLSKMGQVRDWVLQVNDDVITTQEYQRQVEETKMQMNMLIWQLQQQFGPQAQSLIDQFGLGSNPEKQALYTLAERSVLNGVANNLRIVVPESVTKDSVTAQLQQIPGMIDSNGAINVQAMQRIFGYSTVAALEEATNAQQRNAQILQFAEASVYLPEFMLKNHYMKEFAHKNYGIVSVDLDQYLKAEKSKPVSDKEVKAYFEKHNRQSKRYWTPEQRSATVWEFNPVAYNAPVSQKEIERYYKNKKSSEFVSTPMTLELRRIVMPFDKENPDKSRRDAQKAYDEIKADPKSFAAVAKRVSVDSETAKNGGLMKPVKRGDLTGKLSDEAFALKKDGDLSPIFKTDAGLEIVQRVRKNKTQHKKLEDVRNDIVSKIRTRKFNEGFAKTARKAIRQHKDGDTGAINKYVTAKNAVSKKVTLGVNDSSSVASKLFSLKRVGGVAQATEGDKGYLVRADAITKSVEPPLASVKATVINDMQNERAKKAMEKALNEAKSAGGAQLATHANKHGLKYQTTGMVDPKDQSKLQDLAQKQQVPVHELLGLERVGATKVSSSPTAGHVMTILDQQPFDATDYSAKRPELVRSLNQQQKNLTQQGFIASLLRSATIKKNSATGRSN